MPGPYDKFQDAFETFQEQIKELLTEKQQELLEAIKTVPSPQPQSAHNPLEFYETILKVQSHKMLGLIHDGEYPRNFPYFADVYNAVFCYLGGTKATDPIGKKFMEEVHIRFAYLKNENIYKTILFSTGAMRRSFSREDKNGNIEIKFIGFNERDFAVLRQLLEDLYKDQAVKEEKQQIILLTKELQQELEARQQQLQQELDRRQQKQAEQFQDTMTDIIGLVTDAFATFRNEVTQDIKNVSPTTSKMLDTKLTMFRQTLLKDLQAFVKTDKREMELDKAVSTMETVLESMQKVTGRVNANDPTKLPATDDPSFTF